MKHTSFALATAAAVTLTASLPLKAYACRIAAPIALRDIEHADTVVVGRITGYEIVKDEAAREKRREQLANSPNMPATLRSLMENQTVFLSDYARFNVAVDEVLVGKAPMTLTVTWDNSTFGEPSEKPAGRLLIAVRAGNSKPPPLEVAAYREPSLPTILQAPCAPPFMFGADSKEAEAVRAILKSRSKPAGRTK